MENDQLYEKELANVHLKSYEYKKVLDNQLYVKKPNCEGAVIDEYTKLSTIRLDSIGYCGSVYPVINLTEKNGRHFTDETQQKKICTPIVKCMICGSQSGIALEWKTNRKDEKGRKRIICLDCTFDVAEKKSVKKILKEDPCVDSSES